MRRKNYIKQIKFSLDLDKIEFVNKSLKKKL